MDESSPKLNNYVDFFARWVAKRFDVDPDQIDIKVIVNYDDGQQIIETHKGRASV